MPFYIGWIPNYGGITFSSKSMTAVGREFMTGDMKGMVWTPDGVVVASGVGGRRVAAWVAIEDRG